MAGPDAGPVPASGGRAAQAQRTPLRPTDNPVHTDNPSPEALAARQTGSLTVRDAVGRESAYTLDRPVLLVGRDEKSDIRLNEVKCSRKHFLVEMAGDYYNAVDLGSTNGLRVNGRRVPKRRLRDGDVITIGACKLIYRGPTDSSVPDELAPEPEPAPAAAPAPQAPPVPTGIRQASSSSARRFEAELEGLPEEEAPPRQWPAQPEPVDDSKTCPECKGELPAGGPCPQCGYKNLRLRAIEYFVDNVARQASLLGGLGLWKLKRARVMEQAAALEGVAWVFLVQCQKCGRKHREINEWRPRCISCSGCGDEISLPVEEPPELK